MELNSISSKSSRKKNSSSKPCRKVSSSSSSHVPTELMLFPVNTSPPGPNDSIFHDQQYSVKKPKLFEIKKSSLSSISSTSTSNINGGMISDDGVTHGLDLRLSLFPPSHHDHQHREQEQVAPEAHEDHLDHEGGDDDQERYNIRKMLKNSDVSTNLGRLLLGIELVESHVLSVLSDRYVVDVKSGKGPKVMVRDMDEGTDHSMMFKKLMSSKSYVFNSDWTHQFVRRRQLHTGDTIGMYWDPEAKRFCFAVLRRAPREFYFSIL